MSYGFEAYRADGSTMVSTTDGIARLIYSSDFSEAYSGTISVPAFDSNKGYYSYRIYPFLHQIYGGTGYAPLPENSDFTQQGGMYVGRAYGMGPTLAWDNTTKLLTVTANAETEDLLFQVIRYRYRLNMVHYK